VQDAGPCNTVHKLMRDRRMCSTALACLYDLLIDRRLSREPGASLDSNMSLLQCGRLACMSHVCKWRRLVQDQPVKRQCWRCDPPAIKAERRCKRDKL
jgi:hypothetical protein